LGTAAEFHTGFGVSGMLGHRFRNNLRTEFEFSFLDNNNKTFIVFDNGVPIIEDPSSGHVSLRSFMANLYYDVPVENWFPALWRFRPYVGAGIGTTESRINGFTSPLLSGMLGDQGFAPTVLDVASEFTYSWQVRVGVSYLLTNNAEFYAGWRHFETDDLQFNTIPPRDVLPAQQEFGQFGVIDVTGANIDMAEFGLRVFF
jgi:opacity protein-like surface antigen